MKKLVLLFWLMAFFIFARQITHACSCVKATGMIVMNDSAAKPDPEQVKRWRLEQTDFAFFIGQVIKIEKIKFGQGSKDRFLMNKVTVRVEKSWLGVRTPDMTIYTGVGGGDCGVPYVKGKEYFFGASRDRVTGLLKTDICGYTKIDDEVIAGFNSVFGDAKVFR